MAKKFADRLIKRERVKHELKTPDNMLQNVLASDLLFDYSKLGFNEDDKNTLITYEKELLLQKKRVGEIAIKVGDTLEKARDLFNGYKEGEEGYMEWYQSLGYNKDQVYLLRGRYKLSLDNPGYKENIQALSDAEVKEIINKSTPLCLVNKVLQGEVRTAKRIREERAVLGNNPDIEDAVVVMPEVSNKEKIKKRILQIDDEMFKLETKKKLLIEERNELVKKL